MNWHNILKKFASLVTYFFAPSKPSELLLPNKVGICVLLCHRDVTMFIYCLKSLFYHLGYSLPIFVVDDGSLTEKDQERMSSLFMVEILSPQTGYKKMKKMLKNYSYIAKNRFSNANGKYKLKLDAILLNPFDRFIFIEPDVLFFKTPTQIDRWIKSNDSNNYYCFHDSSHFNDINLEIAIRKLIYQRLKIKIELLFNSGLLTFAAKINSKNELKSMNKIFKNFDELSLLDFDGLDDLFLSLFFGQKHGVGFSATEYVVMAHDSQYQVFLKNKNQVIAAHFGHQTKPKFYERCLEEAYKYKFFRTSYL